MRKFRVSGRGKETKRKRSKTYYARSENEARKMATDDKMVVETVEHLPDDPPTPPTGRQLDFARQLKLIIPDDANKEDASYLISIRLKDDKEPTERHRGFARIYRVEHSKYIGKKSLFFQIFNDLKEKGRENELVEWFVFRVYRDLMHGAEATEIQTPKAPEIKSIASELVKEKATVRSIRRYSGEDLIWFGKFIASNDSEHFGGSTNTEAYRYASGLLCDKLGLDRRSPTRRHNEEEQGEASKGCISTIRWILVAVVVLLMAAIFF